MRRPLATETQPPTLEPAGALARLKFLLQKGSDLQRNKSLLERDFDTWLTVLKEGLADALGRGSAASLDILDTTSEVPLTINSSERELEKGRKSCLAGHLDKLSALIELREHDLPKRASSASTQAASQVRVFISHRASDAPLAEALVVCLTMALTIPDETLRCTSVTGYKLDVGDDGPDTLREDLRDCLLVIGLLTESSLDSAFVIMELGAAWALKKRTIPVLSPEVSFSSVPEPIRGKHGARTNDPDGIASLIDVVAREAGFEKRGTPLITKAISTFVARATELAATAMKIAVATTESAPLAATDEQAFVRLRSWVKNVGLARMEQEILFAKIDEELHLAAGMTAKHIARAAVGIFDIDAKSEVSILFKRRPMEIPEAIEGPPIDPYLGVK